MFDLTEAGFSSPLFEPFLLAFLIFPIPTTGCPEPQPELPSYSIPENAGKHAHIRKQTASCRYFPRFIKPRNAENQEHFLSFRPQGEGGDRFREKHGDRQIFGNESNDAFF